MVAAALVVVVLVGAGFALWAAKPWKKEAVAEPPKVEATGCNVTPPAVVPAHFERTKPYKMTIDSDRTYVATFHTSCGTMEARLFAKQSPVTVNNFVSLARARWYNGNTFHSISKDKEEIQGGDPICSVSDPEQGCGTGGPGYTIPAELRNGLKYKVGSVVMAHPRATTRAGSQFFIIAGPEGLKLPRNFTIFGQLMNKASLDVAKKILSVPTGGPEGQTPKTKVWIQSVKITEKK